VYSIPRNSPAETGDLESLRLALAVGLMSHADAFLAHGETGGVLSTSMPSGRVIHAPRRPHKERADGL